METTDKEIMSSLVSTTDHSHHEEGHEDVLIAKGVTMVVLCTVSICMGILPIKVSKWLKWNTADIGNPRSTKVISTLLGFGGGVLFCTTFLHLLPEVKEAVEHLTMEGKLPKLKFSLAETLTCSGFFIMYFVEELVHNHLRKKQAQKEKCSQKDVGRSTNELVEDGQTQANCINNSSQYNGSGHSHHLPVIVDEKDDFVISSLRGLLIVLGLSVHELFEGLAIGLECSASYVWYMFAAVAAHKFVIAFCIGVELLSSKTRHFLSVIYVCTFAIVSPLGIAIGMFLVGGETAAATGILPVLLQGLASGTLLYVVFFEILQEHRDGLRQYTSILFGFVVMFGLQMLRMLPLIVGRYRMNHRQKRHRGISSNSSTCTSISVSNASSSSVISGSATNSQGLQTSLLLCFGGGVLLFTTFLHLAPEVRISVERHQANGQLPTLGTLSLSELLFCTGFFLVYFVEEAVHAALTGKPESSEALLYRTVSVRRCNNQTGTSTVTSTGSTVTMSTTTRSTWKEGNDDIEDSGDELRRRSRQHDSVELHEHEKQGKILPPIFVLSSPTALSSVERSGQENVRNLSDTELKHYAGMKHHEHNYAVITKNTSIQGLLTVLALSFHAIFEGLAVGLEPSIGSVVYLAAAIATHKLVISFCVGMELYVAGASTKRTLGYLTIFSMVTPIGIAIGLALSHFKNDCENLGPTPTILQGMAAGTLLYVVFFEVLARERANEKSGLLQLTAIIVGFMLMLGLQITTAHSHSHSHSHGGHTHMHDHEIDNHPEEDHDHELHSHKHIHSNKSSEQILSDTIEKVTESIAEAVSNVLSSTMKTPINGSLTNSNNESVTMYANES